jgi:hypothetical protein
MYQLHHLVLEPQFSFSQNVLSTFNFKLSVYYSLEILDIINKFMHPLLFLPIVS